jgi:hypothetical protein
LVLFVLSGALPFTLWAGEPCITFKADPVTVEVNKPAVLSWQVAGADNGAEVYLIGVGMVEPEGKTKVFPDGSTTYTLVVDTAAGLCSASVTVKVKGRRDIFESGDTAFPDYADFRHEHTYEIPSDSLIQLMDCTLLILKDSLEFYVEDQYDREKGKMIFVTQPKRKTVRARPGRTRILARQLAYRVELTRSVSNPANTLFRIKTFIENQYSISPRHWRPETSPAIHRQIANQLYRQMKTDSMCGDI